LGRNVLNGDIGAEAASGVGGSGLNVGGAVDLSSHHGGDDVVGSVSFQEFEICLGTALEISVSQLGQHCFHFMANRLSVEKDRVELGLLGVLNDVDLRRVEGVARVGERGADRKQTRLAVGIDRRAVGRVRLQIRSAIVRSRIGRVASAKIDANVQRPGSGEFVQ